MQFPAAKLPAPTVDERELLLSYVRRQRALVVATAQDLTEEQLRWTPDGRLLPILGIINHLTHMEWRWVEGRYLGSLFPARDEEFALPTEVTGSQIIGAYWEQQERTERVVRSASSLDLPCVGDEGGRGPAHVLLGFDDPVDLRWVLLHLIEETAHHAGHADATRQMLDGRRMTD